VEEDDDDADNDEDDIVFNPGMINPVVANPAGIASKEHIHCKVQFLLIRSNCQILCETDMYCHLILYYLPLT